MIELFDREKGRYPRVRVGATGTTAERHFHVNTGDPDAVLGLIGSGLPGIGDPYSPAASLVVATEIEPEFQGGTDAPGGGGAGGHHFVRVSYGPVAVGGGSESAAVGSSWSEVVGSTQQVPATADAAGNPLAQSLGLTAEANTLEVTVTSVKANADALRAFFAVQNRVNANIVTLPGVRGLSATGGGGSGGVLIEAQPGELLARSARIVPVSETRFHLVYTFGLAPLLPVDPAQPNGARASAWYRRYRKVDAAGNPAGPWLVADVQGTVAYPPPGVLW